MRVGLKSILKGKKKINVICVANCFGSNLCKQILSTKMQDNQTALPGEDLPDPLGNWSENESENQEDLKQGVEKSDGEDRKDKSELGASNDGKFGIKTNIFYLSFLYLKKKSNRQQKVRYKKCKMKKKTKKNKKEKKWAVRN